MKTAATGAEFGQRMDWQGNTNAPDDGTSLAPDDQAEKTQPPFGRSLLNDSGIGRHTGGQLSEAKLSAIRDAYKRFGLKI